MNRARSGTGHIPTRSISARAMNRRATRWLVLCAILGVVALPIVGLIVADSLKEITTSLPSPDRRWRAILVDHPYRVSIDRNFHVCIEDPDGVSRTVFTSPDETPLGIGSERFLWSNDSRRLLLVGRRFYLRQGVQLTTGESLYLLYDLPSGKTWCNSDQQGPPFGPEELVGYDFGESLALVAKSAGGPRVPASPDNRP